MTEETIRDDGIVPSPARRRTTLFRSGAGKGNRGESYRRFACRAAKETTLAAHLILMLGRFLRLARPWRTVGWVLRRGGRAVLTPELAVMGDEVRRDRAEVGMLPRLDICGARRRIAEADCARITAHYRTGFIDVRQAERMAQFVCSNVKQYLLSSSPAA